MKTLNIKALLTVVIALLTLSEGALAQQKSGKTGKIAGTVVDSETGETLIGVNIIIKSTGKGTATNLDGEYEISNLKPGTYTLVVSYVSYSRKTITGVDAEAGEVQKLDIAMKPESVGLEEVTVTARSLQNTEAALLSERQKSLTFSNAISAEAISSTGAGNAAEAMKKVVGASVVDGKYVFVRGLGDRYSGTQLNGANLPSADPNKQSFQMDLFPSSLIKNITTIKTFTPDRPGNFTGGLVDVKTKDFPDKFNLELSASTSYNTQSSFENILLGNSSKTDFLGFDQGSRDMPDEVKHYLQSNENFPKRTADMANAETLDRLSNSFNYTMAPLSTQIGANNSYSLSIGNLIQLGGNKLGYTASLTYGRSYSSYSDGTVARWAGGENAETLSSRINLHDSKGVDKVDLGGLVNLSYMLNGNNKITATLLRTQSGSNTGRYLVGSYTKDLSDNAEFHSRTLQYVERGLTSYQVKGKHYIPGFKNSTIKWNASYAKNTQDEPDLRYVWNAKSYLEAFDAYKYSIPGNNVSSPPSRYFRDLDEDNINVGVDYIIPFKTHLASKAKFKFGGSYNTVDRTFREHRIEYQMPENGTFSLSDYEGNINQFFSSENIGVINTENGPAYGLTIRNATAPRNNYDASKDLYSVYGMVEYPILDNLKFAGGIRMEDTDIQTVSQDTSVKVGHLDNNDFLPSANLTYSIRDNMNARASFTRTLARPTFRELAPYVTFSFVGDYLFKGNSDLKRTLITNYDVRWEWFPNPGEIVAVSGFYKNFEHPLENVIRIDIGNNAASIQNVDQGMVYGVELEARKRLDFIDPLRHFLISTNFTLVESQVDIPRLEMVEILGLNTTSMTKDEVDEAIKQASEDEKKRPLTGQSPYTFNFDVTYENPKIGLSAAINYNIFGDRLSNVMRGETPDSYERSYGTLNVVASKSLFRNFVINASVDNILNPDIQTTQLHNGEHFINQSYKKGISYKLGIKYKL